MGGAPTAAEHGKPDTPGPDQGRLEARIPPGAGRGKSLGAGVGERIATIKINTGSHNWRLPPT
eukprot:8196962-Karenia_brevis.AAC.1